VYSCVWYDYHDKQRLFPEKILTCWSVKKTSLSCGVRTSFKAVGVSADIRTEILPNATLELYCYSNKFGKVYLKPVGEKIFEEGAWTDN
jgi:hypothetical protein